MLDERDDAPLRYLGRLTEHASATSASAVTHRVPQVPFVVDGTVYDRGDVKRFDGRPLDFVPSARGDFSSR